MVIKQNKLLKWGLCLNVVYLFLHFIFLPDGFTIINISITSLLLLSIVALGLVCLNNLSLLKDISKTTKVLFYLLFFWGIITLIRGFSLTLQDWVTNFGNVFMGIAWLVPFTVVIGLKIENWNIIFKTILLGFSLTIIATFFLPLIGINEEWIWLLRPINFILLIAFYHFKPEKKIEFFLAVIAYLIISYSGSRRLEFLYLGLTICFILMDKIINYNLRKVIIRYVLFVFSFILFLIFTFGYEYLSAVINTYIEFQDTRTFLFLDFFKDLNFSDRLFGRGSLGTYYSEFIAHTRRYTINVLKKPWWGDVPKRITVEVGYLQMILKGGFIMFLLHISIYMNAAYLAIFKSNNKFVKRLGYYILIISIISLIEFRPAFTPTFILLWVAIGTVLNKKYRMMQDSEIKEIIKFK